jgi:hypothetical protein
MIGALIELLRVSTNLVYLVSQSEVKTTYTITPYFAGFMVMVVGLYSVDVYGSLLQVPIILAISYFVTLLIMLFNMKKLLDIRLNLRISIKTLLLTSPILIVSFIGITPNFLNTFLCLMLGNGYVFLVLYFVLKNKIIKMREV